MMPSVSRSPLRTPGTVSKERDDKAGSTADVPGFGLAVVLFLTGCGSFGYAPSGTVEGQRENDTPPGSGSPSGSTGSSDDPSQAPMPSVYPSVVLEDKPLAYWRFGEASGAVARSEVDSPAMDIFTDTFRSSGWTPSAHVFGGVDVRVYKRLYLSGEGRYLWSSGTPDLDFIDFDAIGLAGFKATVGVHYMF